MLFLCMFKNSHKLHIHLHVSVQGTHILKCKISQIPIDKLTKEIVLIKKIYIGTRFGNKGFEEYAQHLQLIKLQADDS